MYQELEGASGYESPYITMTRGPALFWTSLIVTNRRLGETRGDRAVLNVEMNRS